tara:strand:+ start:4981 stop:5946 length:966 start_codon:yes stop_codon:yes gene_type:complete
VVYGFGRKIHAVKNYTILDGHENITYQKVATLEDGKYWNRIFKYLKLLVVIYQNHGLSRKHLYIVGIDLRLMSVLVINKYVEYVISDLAWLYYPQPFKKIFGIIDKLLAKYSNKVLMTSKGFYEGHFKSYVKKENLELTENKLATYGKVFPLTNLKDDKIRIAYIGAFRYKEIISNLLKVVAGDKRLELNFYGDGFSDIVDKMKKYASKHENITFNGAFKNPDDLQAIYQENNLNFVVYNNTLENERLAMPNKFYESGFFNVPILCATNTYVGKRAEELKMGWTCDITELSIKNFLSSLTIDDIKICHERMKKLDKALFNY